MKGHCADDEWILFQGRVSDDRSERGASGCACALCTSDAHASLPPQPATSSPRAALTSLDSVSLEDRTARHPRVLLLIPVACTSLYVRLSSSQASYHTRRPVLHGLLIINHFSLPFQSHPLAYLIPLPESSMPADTPPSIKLNGAIEPTTMDAQPPVQNYGEPPDRPVVPRNDTTYSKFSLMSMPPEGSILTGKQEHCTRHRSMEGRVQY